MTTPAPRLRDERLAWLAVQDDLRKASRRGFGVLLNLFVGGRGWSYRRGKVTSYSGADINKQVATGRMVRYSIAVDEQAKRLSAEERQVLRTTGTVPPWFLDTVITEAKKIKI